MPHNSYIHGTSSSSWPNGYVLTQTDFQLLDTAQFQAVNGDLGGTYAPSSGAIVIGGQGLQVNGAGVYGTITNGATLLIDTDGKQALEGTLHAYTGSSAVFDAGSKVTVSGSVTMGSGAALLLQTGSVINSSGTATFSNTISFNGGSMTGRLAAAGTGRVSRRFVIGSSGDYTYSIADGDVFLAQAGSSARTYQLSSGGAYEGDSVIFSKGWINLPYLTIVNDVGAGLLQIGTSATPPYVWGELFFHSGAWLPTLVSL